MGTHGDDHARRFVTNAELDKKLDEKPGRWEVRCLILAAILAAPSIPSLTSIAQAASNLVR